MRGSTALCFARGLTGGPQPAVRTASSRAQYSFRDVECRAYCAVGPVIGDIRRRCDSSCPRCLAPPSLPGYDCPSDDGLSRLQSERSSLLVTTAATTATKMPSAGPGSVTRSANHPAPTMAKTAALSHRCSATMNSGSVWLSRNWITAVSGTRVLSNSLTVGGSTGVCAESSR